jgi:hypothetical protein
VFTRCSTLPLFSLSFPCTSRSLSVPLGTSRSLSVPLGTSRYFCGTTVSLHCTLHCTALYCTALYTALWHHCLSGTVCHALSILVSVFALPFLGTVLCTALLGYALLCTVSDSGLPFWTALLEQCALPYPSWALCFCTAIFGALCSAVPLFWYYALHSLSWALLSSRHCVFHYSYGAVFCTAPLGHCPLAGVGTHSRGLLPSSLPPTSSSPAEVGTYSSAMGWFAQ